MIKYSSNYIFFLLLSIQKETVSKYVGTSVIVNVNIPQKYFLFEMLSLHDWGNCAKLPIIAHTIHS